MISSSSSPEVPKATDNPSLNECGVSTEKTEIPDCAICLDTIKVAGEVDSCSHSFCFSCIIEWSKVTNKCPICAGRFKAVVEKDLTSKEPDSEKKNKKRKRKPKKVKVANKEQRVSYEHTGIFDDEFDSDDSYEDYEDISENTYGNRRLLHYFRAELINFYPYYTQTLWSMWYCQ